MSRHFDHDQSAAVEPLQQWCPVGRPKAEAVQEDDGVLPIAHLEGAQLHWGFGELDASILGPEPVAGERGCFGLLERRTPWGGAFANEHRDSSNSIEDTLLNIGKVDRMADAVKARRAYDTSLRAEQARVTRQRIAETALRLFLARGYNAVTMTEIATEAGVAYQTVYAVFGNKQRLAHEIIWTTFTVEGVHELLAEVTDSPDPEVWLRRGARIVRVVSARLGGLLTFLRESGDPALQAEYQNVEARRREQRAAVRGQVGPEREPQRGVD